MYIFKNDPTEIGLILVRILDKILGKYFIFEMVVLCFTDQGGPLKL